MAAPWDIKTGKGQAWIDVQLALYWELVRNGTDEGLSFDKENHIFTVNGEKLPSVTYILRHEGIIPDIQFVTDRGLLRGTYVHKATELWDADDLIEESLDDEIRAYLECYKQFRKDYPAVILHAEKKLYHPVWKYAGIVDRIAEDKESMILYLQPETKKKYTFKPVENIRGNLNIGLSALNLMRWKEAHL